MTFFILKKPIDTFFSSSYFMLSVFLFFGSIFYMANLSDNLANGIALFLGWFAFTAVFVLFQVNVIGSDSTCNCKCDVKPSGV